MRVIGITPETVRVSNCLHLNAEVPRRDRPKPFDDDVSFSEALVEAILDRYTAPGDVVLDPFAGFGTTIAVAERMGRAAYGIELLADRADYIRSRVAHPDRVITGDARSLQDLDLPPINFSLSSPPYMTRTDHPQNPLTGYSTLDGDYATYLREVTAAYLQVAALMTGDAHLAVNVANIRSGSRVTLLAWDIGTALNEHLPLEAELPICIDRQHPSISQDYCLVFLAGRV